MVRGGGRRVWLKVSAGVCCKKEGSRNNPRNTRRGDGARFAQNSGRVYGARGNGGNRKSKFPSSLPKRWSKSGPRDFFENKLSHCWIPFDIY